MITAENAAAATAAVLDATLEAATAPLDSPTVLNAADAAAAAFALDSPTVLKTAPAPDDNAVAALDAFARAADAASAAFLAALEGT